MSFPLIGRDVSGADAPTTRIDLHLHSRASTDTGSWFLSRTLMPESFVDPAEAYAACKRRGMDLVTLTDHNTISGALEIAHHPDVIIGVEITAFFPDDGVPMHVLAWGIDEPLWGDLDRARANIVDLVDLLDERQVPCALAHPLHRVGERLSVDHLERCLLLFRLWEGRNGARPRECNEVAVRIASAGSPALLARLADKHDLAPRTLGPPALTGGSDDHALLSAASTWTETPAAPSPEALLDRLWAGRTSMHGSHGTATHLAQSVGTLPLKRYLIDGAPGLPDPLRRLLADLVEHPISDPPQDAPATTAAVSARATAGEDVLRRIRRDRAFIRQFRRIDRQPDSATRSHARLTLASEWLHRQALTIALAEGDFSLWTIGTRIDALGAAAAVAAPYFTAGRYFRGEARHAAEFGEAFFGAPAASAETDAPHALVVTDTFDELNGAAGTMRRYAAWSGAQTTPPATIVTCGPRAVEAPGLIRLRSVADCAVPAYEVASWRLGVPSALELLEVIERSGANVIHAATPGPMGVAGLLAARALDLPFVASYHTELAEYALRLTGDRLAADLAGRAVGWFYSQAARVYVPTRTTGRGLMEQGVDPARLFIFGRGVDTELFRPDRHSRVMRHRVGGRSATVLLYVGRLSREKGLEVLAAAHRRAAQSRPEIELVLVGEGPYRAELAGLLAGTRHRFLGPLTGRELASAYASADVFCLPSRTETFGQVVLEAAASGLPVIVTDRGGAHESVLAGETGLIVPADDAVALGDAVVALAADSGLRRRLGSRGRQHAAQRSGWSEVFGQLVTSYEDIVHRPSWSHTPPDTAALAPTPPR
jgi:glycosyltransferase involved in cell wall biosynthesis